MPIGRIGEEVSCDVSAVEAAWKRAAMVDNPAGRDVTSFETCVRDVIEVTKSVRIMQRPVFAEALDIVTALHLVQPDLFAEIRPGNEVAVLVEVDAPGVAATFGEHFKFVRHRMVSPDALLKFKAPNVGRHRAS